MIYASLTHALALLQIPRIHVNHSLNSLRGAYMGDYIGEDL